MAIVDAFSIRENVQSDKCIDLGVIYSFALINLTSIETHMFEQADPSGSELSKRRQNFRNQVRRIQIDEYFDRRRKELLS